jgi:hypothetical protein
LTGGVKHGNGKDILADLDGIWTTASQFGLLGRGTVFKEAAFFIPGGFQPDRSGRCGVPEQT